MNEIERIMTELTKVSQEKQNLIEKETVLKSQLLGLMQNQKINKLENVVIRVNLMNGFIRSSVDSKKLCRLYPDAAKVCMKNTTVAPFVKVTVK